MSEVKNKIKIYNEGNLVINKDNFVHKEILIEENGEVISRINICGEGVEIEGKKIIVNGEKIYN